MGINITESIMTLNPCYTANKKIEVQGIFLHSIGCPQPDAKVIIKDWNRKDYNTACVHGFIDGNTGEIFQTLPWDHRGWHCGKGSNGSGNNTHIGIEMCEPKCIKYTKGATFECSNKEEAITVSKRTWDSAVKLFAYLCEQFNLDPLKDGVILGHAEGYKRGISSNHGDPAHMWEQLGMTGYSMDSFRKAVKDEMNANKEEPSKLRGETDEEKIWNYLYDNLGNNYGVAGLMGNFYAESALSPINLQDSYNKRLGYSDKEYTKVIDNGSYKNFTKDSAGYGLAQWTYWSRKQELYNYSKLKNKSIGDLEMQLEFLISEISSSFKTVFNGLKSATSVKEASDLVLTKFEKPADQSDKVKDIRAKYGQGYYDKYVPKEEVKSVLYVVQAGAYSVKSNAIIAQEKMAKAGYDTIIVKDGSYYRVQAGAFSKKQNATNLVNKLNQAGFKAIIKEK